ncbi:MAG: glycosyltransferase [Candidatus Marinimicrobia bacterium]|jgi:glycosyltransferase involved in cell wall biosynthesis|nr:glycosyltransferase [Candidatus Neomarinimicrobiota bacterium]
MDISVVIPTFNRKHTLPRAIDSVLSQSISPLEILVIDDGSTDDTNAWIQTTYPEIKFIKQPNHGVSAARNMGIKTAKSDWIALLDSDDEWLPDKLEKQVEMLNQNPGIKFCHTEEIWVRNGVRVNQKKKHQKYGGDIFEHCLDMCRISPSSAIFHQSILDDVGYFDEGLSVCEDYDLWLRITVKYPVLFLDEPLIKKYGGHEDQLSKVSDGIETYRIQVLEKLIQQDFTFSQKKSMEKMLIRKLKIYANGAQKRGKEQVFNQTMKRIDELSAPC